MNTDHLPSATVAILDRDGAIRGTGIILTTSGLLATCVHVLTQASIGPGGKVDVAFHGPQGTSTVLPATVVEEWWKPDCDLSILRLQVPLPQGAIPVELGTGRSRPRVEILALGYASSNSGEASWADGRIVGSNRDGLLQLASTQITHGFSGGPVVTKSGQLIGIAQFIVSPDESFRNLETAYAIPAERLFQICHELKPSPRRSFSFEDEEPSLLVIRNPKQDDNEQRRLIEQFYQGAQARYEHILANADIIRTAKLDQIDIAFRDSRLVVVRGASGQGKSALAYRYIYNRLSSFTCIEVRLLENQGHAARIARLLERYTSECSEDLLLYFDVTPSDTSWPILAREVTERVANTRVLVTIREEDWRRTIIAGQLIKLSDIDVSFEEREAQELVSVHAAAAA